jgi:hypothetical protein
VEEIMRDDAIVNLKQNLRGAVIGRGDPSYDDARALYNGVIDKRPRVIACRAGVAGAGKSGRH